MNIKFLPILAFLGLVGGHALAQVKGLGAPNAEFCVGEPLPNAIDRVWGKAPTGETEPVGTRPNLLPQGSFERPDVNTGWAEGFNIPNNEEFKIIAEGGKQWLRIENRDAGRQLDYVHAFVKVTPQIASLTVSVRLKATNLKIGKEGWHTARVALVFEGGSFGFPAASARVTG